MWVFVNEHARRIKINTDFIILMMPDDYIIEMSSGNALQLNEKDYNDLETKMFPKRKVVTRDDEHLADLVNELHKLCGGTGTVLLTSDRRKNVERLKKEGFTEDQLRMAARNIGASEWMQGKNDRGVKYGKVDYLIRKPADGKEQNVNKWLDVTKQQKKMF